MYSKAMRPSTRLAAATTLLALPLMPLSASADSEMTDFAFEVLDPGFCLMPPPEISDAELRDILAEQGDDIPLTGEMGMPFEAAVYGNGLFARGSGRNAIASSVHAMLFPADGEITALCLALVPVNDMNSTEGQVVLRGPDAEPEQGDYYMAFARILGRDSDGAEHVISDLEAGEGTLDFVQDGGDLISGSLTLSGNMSDGTSLKIGFEFTVFEDEHLRFVDLSSN